MTSAALRKCHDVKSSRALGRSIGQNVHPLFRIRNLAGLIVGRPEPLRKRAPSPRTLLAMIKPRTRVISRRYTSLVRNHSLTQEFITPHCRRQHGMAERVIRTLRVQCLHRQRFESIRHATRAIGDRISFHNHRRPYQTPDIPPPR